MERHDTILLVCDEPQNREILRSVLQEHYNLLEAANIQQAGYLLQQNADCIAAAVLDITAYRDPHPNGGDARQLPAQTPLILISADEDPGTVSRGLSHGAADVIPLNYDQDAMLMRIENVIQLRLHKLRLQQMEEDQQAILRRSNDAMVDALSSIIEYRSVESGQHILRIRHFTKLLLEEVARCCPEYGLTESVISIISSASALHDVGKIAIPDAILTKPGPLTREEMEVMKSHSVTGCRMLERLGNLVNQEYLRYAHNICHYHHERWDGGGYPDGLRGDQIPICAQVVGLADVYDALTTKRVYKDAYSFDTAVNMILKAECGVFSPKLLECFKHITGEYEALARAYADGLEPESEKYDVELPVPSPLGNNDSMERTWSKYQSLVHYVGAFLMELDLDQGLFHVIYNPYPEFVSFQNVSTFADLEKMVLDKLALPGQRDQLYKLIHQGMDNFIQAGLRRSTQNLCLRSRNSPEGEPFEITFLRINPVSSNRRTMAVLCRRVSEGDTNSMSATGFAEYAFADTTYCCRLDQDFTLMQEGPETYMLAGYTMDEVREVFGGRLAELVLPEDRQTLRIQMREQLAHGTTARVEYRLRHKDGSVHWVMNNARLAVEGDGREYLYCFLTDISSAKEAVDNLNEKLNRYEIILAQTENVLFEWDMATDRITFSDTWEKIFGFEPISENVRTALISGSFFHPDDLPLLVDRISNLENNSPYEMAELRIATAKGRYLWCRFRATAIRDESGRLRKISGIIININTEKEAEQALQEQAERDSLTKLLNKDAGRKYAEEYFHQFARNLNCALLIIDLDDFKLVNDRYGHLFGDAVLTKVAREIKKFFRNQDIIARIGGDEFMVLMRGFSDRPLVEKRCGQLIRALQNVFRDQKHPLPLSCSVGIALGPAHGSSYVELFQRADHALYRAKFAGKHNYRFYDPEETALPASQWQATAVSQRIDSDEQPGLANGNIVQYAFQRLYSSSDVRSSINYILELIGRQTNVSRVYIFENSPDNRFCSNTYEWCNEGVAPEIDNLQNVSYETDIPDYEHNFNEEGIFYCPDVNELPGHIYDIVAPQGIKSMLHCAIRDNGVFRGYIGFDDCASPRFWTKEQIRVLSYFSEMLSVFLLKRQAQEKISQRAAELSSILDNQNAWIYIIDPDTCELKYLNAKTRSLAQSAAVGMTCYQSLMGRSERCKGCPSRDILSTKTCACVMDNPKFNLKVQAEATLIQWEGKASCLLTCREA